MDISFILVEPKVPENIGSAARAIKTMGFSNLVLVKPCAYKEGKARYLAHGSDDVLDSARVFQNLGDAVNNYDLLIGTTSKHRINKGEYIEIKKLGKFLHERKGEARKIAVVFGREETGLTNEELELCDITSTVAMARAYPSLNLSHAVMLYAHELSPAGQWPANFHNDIRPDTRSLYAVKEKIEDLLEGTDIGKNKALKGRIMERVSMARLKDLRLLHSVANALIKKYGEGVK